MNGTGEGGSMRTYVFPDVHPASAGPWADEPDKAQWIDQATDLDCLIVRTAGSGSLCGYVGVPPGHRWHGADYDTPNVYVHGGLTFAGLCQEGAEEDGPGICHVPEPGRPATVWWLGFDTAHGFDLCPNFTHLLGDSIAERSVYRDFAYVHGQVTQLAEQIGQVTA